MFRRPIFLATVLMAVAFLACGGPDAPDAPEAGQPGSAQDSSQADAAHPGSASAGQSKVDIEPLLQKLQRGVDVSRFSGKADWKAVAKEGFGFVVAKATEGVDLKDSSFEAHWQGIKEAGLLRGAYHFYVTEDPPEDQARWFIENVQLQSGDLAPVVDIEMIGHDTDLGGLPQRLRTFLELLEEHYGVKPIIYTSPNFWDKHFAGDFNDHPLWIAEYGVDAPRLPGNWPTWHLWQHEGNTSVPGIEKDADLTRSNHGQADLAALIMP